MLLPLLIALAAQPSVGLAIQPSVGLSEAEATTVKTRITSELTGFGLQVVDIEPADPACVADASCVENARQALAEPKDAMLVVEMIRVGPVIQLTATGAAGEEKMNSSHSLDEQQLAQGPVLPDQVRPWAERIARRAANNAPPDLGDKNPDNGDKPDPDPKKNDTAFPPLTPLKSGALFAGGVGVIALGAGVILVATSEPTLQNPASLGTEKEQARTLGFVGLGAGVVGVAALGGAAGLWLLE
jgi:hypothetical protein